MIGRRIKLQALLDSVPKLVSKLGPSAEDAHHAAVGITTTDLVSKSAAIEVPTFLILSGLQLQFMNTHQSRLCSCGVLLLQKSHRMAGAEVEVQKDYAACHLQHNLQSAQLHYHRMQAHFLLALVHASSGTRFILDTAPSQVNLVQLMLSSALQHKPTFAMRFLPTFSTLHMPTSVLQQSC